MMVCELIDTLWNVNEDTSVKIGGSAVELIDTLWNVNFIKEKTFDGKS